MPKGRKRKPTVIKANAGTLQPCRTNENEPNYVLLNELPDPPKYLSKLGKDVYYSTAKELQEIGILKQVNITLFVMYCTQVAIYFEAMERIHKEGYVSEVVTQRSKDGNPTKISIIINPFIKIANDSLAASVRIACEFGITPATSSKVAATPLPTKSKAAQIVEKLNKFKK